MLEMDKCVNNNIFVLLNFILYLGMGVKESNVIIVLSIERGSVALWFQCVQ